MSIFPTIFKMQYLKRLFYYYFAALMLLTFLSLAAVAVIDIVFHTTGHLTIHSWSYPIILLPMSYAHANFNKKQLAELRNFTDPDRLFEKYTQFYKKRLVLNFLMAVLLAILFVISVKNLFFWVLLLQVLVSFAFFPRQAQIIKDLPDRDITFE